MGDNRCKIERTTCAENFHFFLTCHYCFDLYSNVNDPPVDLSVWGQLGQHLTQSRCSVNVTERMNEGQALTRQKHPGEGQASIPSPLIATKEWDPQIGGTAPLCHSLLHT